MLPYGNLSSHGCEGSGVSVQTLFNEAGGRKRRESGFGQWSSCKGKDNGAHIDVNISCIGVDLHILKVHTSSCEVVHVDGPLTIWRNIGRAVLSRGSHPYEGLVAEVSREIDDDVCVVDAVFIG